jgi:carboxypeptidase PM20D1
MCRCGCLPRRVVVTLWRRQSTTVRRSNGLHAPSTLEKHQFGFSIDPVVASLFDYIGPESGIINRLLFANRWLFKPLILAALSRRDTGAAILRTTIAPTVFRAGTKEQSLPESGYAIVNFRTMPGQTSTHLLGSVRAILRGHAVDVAPYDVPHEASPTSRVGTASFQAIAKTIREIYPETIVAPALAPGRADAAYYYGLADDVYLFAPYVFSSELLETAHGHNERISVQNYFSMIRFYVRLIERLAGEHLRHQLQSSTNSQSSGFSAISPAAPDSRCGEDLVRT